MSIEPGKKLGPHQIVSRLGAGGMGEVYEARDTRLNRTVAIKVLPEHLAGHAALRERFEREARAVSSLNHPHICALHDVGEQDGIHYLVMEHIEGETLADRLKRGALPFDPALRYAAQIADALDKAHRAGIVHRDLKPGNVMLTKSGVKLLDFGLAKTREETEPLSNDSEQPTQNQPLTGAGTILGTVQYMAPEQLEGKEVDARADLFALGAVLYEMLTGKKAFEGESQASLISAILSDEPGPVSDYQASTPPALDRVVAKCLAKDPDDRWQTARDLEDELSWIRNARDEAREAPAPRGRYGAVVAIGALIALALLANLWPRPPRAGGPARLVMDIPPGQIRLEASVAPPLDLSPDGDRVAYVGEDGTTHRLYVRRLDQFEAEAVAGSEGAQRPFFSPDGDWVGFYSNGRLRKAPIAGGAPVVICELETVGVASWGSDDTIVVATGLPSVLRRVSASGGQPQPLDTPDFNAMWPSFLPDGKHVLYGAAEPDGRFLSASTIKVLTLETGETSVVMTLDTDARQMQFVSSGGASDGHIVYLQDDGGLFAVPFDAASLAVTGTPVPVLSDVHVAVGNGSFATSLRGSLAYVPGSEAMEVLWVDRSGVATEVPIENLPFAHPRLSPDGTHVVLHEAGRARAWIYDVAYGGRRRLGSNSLPRHAVWSPGGNQLAYGQGREIYRLRSDGSGEAELLWSSENVPTPISWSSDDRIAFEERAASGFDIWVLDVRERSAEPWMDTSAREASPVFSRDGKWLAYVSYEGGRPDVYVKPYPGPGPTIPVSVGGGAEPLWSPDGKELFYRDGERMLVVTVETAPSFSVSAPRELFTGSFQADLNGHPHYGVAPDGQRFLMLRNEPAPVVRVILDWADELKESVPAER